jgi:hypothetical protein
MTKIADLKKNCDCGIAEFQNNISVKTCGIAIADSKKVARAHL